MSKIVTPDHYMRQAKGNEVYAAQLWALDWKRAAIERCEERDILREKIRGLTVRVS